MARQSGPVQQRSLFMKKTISVLLLTVLSTGAWAEWVKVSESAEGTIIYYADPATMRKAGDKVQLTTLTDYGEPQVVSKTMQFQSVRMQDEFNCADQTGRHLSLSALSENMAAGKVVGSEKSPAAWRPIPANTADEDMWKFACGKK